MNGLVISGGRVVDPASGMDSVADVALLDGKMTPPQAVAALMGREPTAELA